MKTSLLKKLFAIMITSSSFLSAAYSQIVYTDVQPDKTFSCTTGGCTNKYYLDLNNDGVNDFKLQVSESHAPCGSGHNLFVKVFIFDSNKVVSSTSVVADKLLANAIIGQQSMYNSSDSAYLTESDYIHICIGFPRCNWSCLYRGGGSWITASDGYLGLKLIKGSNIYYGWARLSDSLAKDISASFTIKDYAYNTIPNQPILAGETICAAPTVTLKANGSLNFCAGDSVILNATGTGYLYQWKKNGANISGATHKRYIVRTAGTYKCNVTNSCGSVTSAGKIVTVTCLQPNFTVSDEKLISKATQLQITPNPFSNTTTISLSIPQSQKVSIQIFDATGRVIKVFADEQMQAGTHQFVWDARDEKGNDVSAGIYFLRMRSGDYVETRKIVAVK